MMAAAASGIKWRRVNVQFIAGLGDPSSSSGSYVRRSISSRSRCHIALPPRPPASPLLFSQSVSQSAPQRLVPDPQGSSDQPPCLLHFAHPRSHLPAIHPYAATLHLARRPRATRRPDWEFRSARGQGRHCAGWVDARCARLVGGGVRSNDGETRVSACIRPLPGHWGP